MFRKSKKLAIITMFLMIISLTFGFVPDTGRYVYAANDILSVDEIKKNMGLGWNLGNSLESCGAAGNAAYDTTDIKSYEKYWGNPEVTKDLITAVKNKGFNTIRIPITWYEHICNDGSYSIDSKWMARVREVVDYAYNQGMYVIINVHHENWINRSDFTSSYDAMSVELKSVWRQIAVEFADYDQHLIFEGMNEPRAVGDLSINEWMGNDACYDIVNKLNYDFVETVRSVQSDYKSNRLLMIPCYAASSSSSVYAGLTIPKVVNSIDSDNDSKDDYIAVSLHAYSPYEFAMGDSTSHYSYDHSEFSNYYMSDLDNIFNDIRSTFTDKSIPVVIGEFSASDYNNTLAREDWAQYYMTTAKEMGIPCVLWDNNVCLDDSVGKENFNYSEVHGYINRDNLGWYANSLPVVNKLLTVLDDSSIVWGSKSQYPINAHASFSDGNNIVINEYYTINDAIPFLTDNMEIAVQYTDVIPKLALANSEWEGWTVVSPYDFDSSNKIAYFSYESIKNVWNSSYGTIGNIKVINSSNEGLTVSGVKVLSTKDIQNPEEPDEPEPDEPEPEEPEPDEPKPDEPKPEEPEPEMPKQEEPKSEEPKQEESKSEEKQSEELKPDTIYSDDKNQAVYKITKAGLSGGCVEYVKPVDKNTGKIIIPATAIINDTSYKVTGIAKGAFKNNKKLTEIVMGNNIESIGADAFYGCSKLKTVSIGKYVTSIGDKAFCKCMALTKITIPSKVSKIGKQAFYECKKLKSITIKTTKLTSGKIGYKAFKGIFKNAVIKTPKAKRKTYESILKKKGIGKGVKIK